MTGITKFSTETTVFIVAVALIVVAGVGGGLLLPGTGRTLPPPVRRQPLDGRATRDRAARGGSGAREGRLNP